MKKIITLSFMLLTCIFIFAQEINLWQNFRQSALTPSQLIHLKWENVTAPLDTMKLFYKKNAVVHTQALQAEELVSFHTSIPQPDTDVPSVALAVQSDLYGVITPFKLAATTPFSVPLMVKACGDSVNEASLNNDTKLDILSLHYAYSDSKLACGIKNQAAAYPTSGTIVGPYYMYGVGFLNPENPMDSTVYAMIRANLVGVITSGLFKLHISDFSELENIDLSQIVRIGDITTSTDNGMLVMSCDWSLLTNDEDFGQWPSYSKSLLSIPFIMKVPSIVDFNITGDVGNMAIVNFEDLSINTQSNTAPVLSNSVVLNPNNYIVSVTYNDAQHNFPLYANFKVDGVDYPMLPQSLDFENPVVFTAIVTDTQWDSGQCFFSDDSLNVVNYTISSTSNDSPQIIPSQTINAYPNPVNFTNQCLNIVKSEVYQEDMISIFNLKGQKINSFPITKNSQSIQWNGKDQHGNLVSNGIYFIKSKNTPHHSVKVLVIK